jgi:hypothetical protein
MKNGLIGVGSIVFVKLLMKIQNKHKSKDEYERKVRAV